MHVVGYGRFIYSVKPSRAWNRRSISGRSWRRQTEGDGGGREGEYAPIESFLESISLDGATLVDRPLSVLERVETELF
jgi:hypothetical protein